MLGEDVEDERRPVKEHDIRAKQLLQLALVTWRKLVVKDDNVGLKLLDPDADFLSLTAPDKSSRVNAVRPLNSPPNHFQPSCISQQGKLIQRFLS
jgi:hypothetical protein